MSQLDPTLATPFRRTESRFKISTPESLIGAYIFFLILIKFINTLLKLFILFLELHLLYISLGKENSIQRLFVDWCCLIKNMKEKAEKIRVISN